MHLLHPAGLDRGDEGRMRVEREMRADLPSQAERLAISRQQEFDRSRVEADAVVESLHPVTCIDALDGNHGGQDLRLGHRGGVACEERLHVERLLRLHDEMHEVPGNVDARHTVHDLRHLCDD